MSEKPKYAPAPYATVDVGSGQGFHTYIQDSAGRKIGVVWGPVDEKVWTAALFAASPALLAGCKAMLGYMESGLLVRSTKNDTDEDWALKTIIFVKDLKEMHAAVEKATGEST